MNSTSSQTTEPLSILWLARTLPLPLNAGDRIYTAALATCIAQAGAKVTFLGLANPDEPMGPTSQLSDAIRWIEVAGRPKSKARAVASLLPFVGARFGTQSYASLLTKLIAENRYDVIVLDQYALVWALPLLKRGAGDPILVHVAHDVEMEVTLEIAHAYRGNFVRKAVLLLNAWKTRLAEMALVKTCDAIVALTEYDAETLSGFRPSIARIVVAPGYQGSPRPPRTMTSSVPRQVVILGSYRWVAKQMNLTHFLREARTTFEQADIACCVVGSVPDELLPEWKSEFPFVRFMGFVDDIQAVLDQSRIGLVVETIGGGFKLKMLDYIFRRVPMAGIDGSMRGLPAAVARHTMSAPNAAGLAKLVEAHINDIEMLQSMQTHAYDAAKDDFNWRLNGDKLLAFLVSLHLAKRSSFARAGDGTPDSEPATNPAGGA